METTHNIVPLLWLGVALGPVLTAVGYGAASPGPRGLIVNELADAMFGCFDPAFRIDETCTREQLVRAYHSLVDRYAGTQVTHLFLNVNYQRTCYPSAVWASYWDNDDPATLTTGWPRSAWIVHTKGVDPFAVCIGRCRERGISPWVSVRMNDTHYIDDPHKTSPLWQSHPEYRCGPNRGFDFALEEVRQYHLALLGELIERYDADGIELDWMRFPYHFKPGQEAEGRALLNDFTRQARALAAQWSAKRGRRIQIAARIPAVPEFSLGLGMDGAAWVREGWVDMLILASVWRPTDTDIPVEAWRAAIGNVAHDYTLAAGADLWLQGAPGGRLMKDDLESARGFTAAMLDRGADQIYWFNHFNPKDFRHTFVLPGGARAVRDGNQAMLRQCGRLESVVGKPRRHVVTFHDPAPPGAANPKALPAEVSHDRPAAFRIYAGPKPATGRVVVRVGIDDLPGAAQAQLGARVNGAECAAMEDLSKPEGIVAHGSPQSQGVPSLAQVARRVAQLEAPASAMRRGYNHVELLLRGGGPQRIVWLELYIVP